MDESTIVQQLHALAASINAAKTAGNDAAVQGLYTQFTYWADRYREIGTGNLAVLTLINKVSDVAGGVVGSLGAVANQVGKAASDIVTQFLKGLTPILVLLAIGLALFVLVPRLLRR